ncbi:hypothetical protein FP744_10009490 [Trichoderma asperellum]|nr:hypothetical protein LI328DRAFT_167328 [Trichoderma asperelloides]
MANKTWFLSPDFTFLPEGQIALGRIIPSPRQPTTTLTSLTDHPTITLPEIQSIIEKNCSFSTEKSRSFGFKLFAKFLEIANAKVDVSLYKSQSFSTADHEVRTYSGTFTPEIMKAIVALDSVKRHIDSGRFGKRRVYIISGIRVAQQSFTVTNQKKKQVAASLGMSGFMPVAAAPDMAGIKITNNINDEATNSYETAPGIVFAYQLHVIRSKDIGEEGGLFSDRTAFFSGEAEDEIEEIEIVEVDRAVLREDLDEQLDGYSERWFEGIDDESYIVSKTSI